MSSIMEQLLAENAGSLNSLIPGSIVKGTVIEIRDNNVVVDIGGKSEGVVPASEFADVSEIQIGDEIEVYLEKAEDRNGAPVISYDKAQQKKNWETIVAECKEGSVMPGRVKAKVKGGLIVSMGIDAFLPASQIDVQPPKNLDQYIGQTYDFKILKINLERKNLVISRRELIEEQRNEKRRALLEEVKPGDVRRGVVKNITDYGAFVDLDGLDGLLHITDMSWGRISHPSEVLKVGEEIDVMIIEIDRERERVSLGLKQCTPNPWDSIEKKYPVGSKVHGKVVNLVQYGAFVELEQGVEGLVHVTELSWTKRITKPSDVLKIGQEVDAVILGINKEEQKISLGIRQLEQNPWEMVRHNYPVGARVHGKVRNLTTFGAFVELEEGIDGMVHVSDMSWTRHINHPGEMLKKGDEVEAIVLDVDADQQRIALGIKQTQDDPWDEIDRKFHIGDIVTGKVSKIANFGAFVELADEIDGLVHISQISEERVEKIKDVLKLGQEVTARVIKIDKDERRIGLSIKAANYDPAQLQAEISAYERVRGPSSERSSAPATMSTSTGGDFANLGDILDNL
ncbi:30S ribosomal protein S1 [Candidatus Spyradosoma sp. SGI.093]|uniref:30S ribosomal protein S1 n=1 Tax=Candidatus Spyradosoma sp. SGI.093 TaxID=3420583 RepID=UPI003CFDA2F1